MIVKGCLDKLRQPFILASASYTMLVRFIILFIAAFAHEICSPVYAQDSSGNQIISYTILAGSKVTVIGSTNVNEFACVSEKTIYDHQLSLSTNATNTSSLFSNAILKVKTESLDCGNAVMNTNLCATMHGDQYPFIVVELAEVQSADGKPIRPASANAFVAKTYITLAGKKKVNNVKVESVKNADGSYRFSGKHQISLSSYGLEPPRAFFGLIKVNDVITVQFDLIVSVREVQAP